MKVIIEPGSINGAVSAPPSKSMTQRAYAAALLHKGATVINCVGTSDDELAARQIVTQLGAQLTSVTNTATTIFSDGLNPQTSYISCGESGLAARLFTPIASLSAMPMRINGKDSLLRRPMEGVADAMNALGVTIPDFKGYIPFTVKGPLIPKSITIDASHGSQFLSGLLFALCASATEAITIDVTNLKSKPYIDLTLDVLKHFGWPVTNLYHRRYIIDPNKFTTTETVKIDIEGDWSGAANLLVAGALAGAVTVSNLSTKSVQADKAILEALTLAGVNLHIAGDSITTTASLMRAFDIDATHCPDLFPILAILAAFCEGESNITGVHRLFTKESNRVESIADMLWDFDVQFSIEDDILSIVGGRYLQGTIIDSFRDHRIVMAAAVGALRANGPVEITNSESVNKSYPAFFKDLRQCGVQPVFTNNNV